MDSDGRSSSFKTGAVGGPGISAGLASAGSDQTAKAKQSANEPHSTLDLYLNIRSPGNGNSDTDAARQTPSGQLPSKNDGYSASTYGQLNPNFSHTINTA